MSLAFAPKPPKPVKKLISLRVSEKAAAGLSLLKKRYNRPKEEIVSVLIEREVASK